MAGGVLSAPRRGWRLWYAMTSGIVWWLVHVTSLAALAEVRCGRAAVEWTIHGLTVFTGAATLVAIAWSASLIRAYHDDAASATEGGRLRFCGLFGLAVSTTSLVLIAWEGLYVPFVDACR